MRPTEQVLKWPSMRLSRTRPASTFPGATESREGPSLWLTEVNERTGSQRVFMQWSERADTTHATLGALRYRRCSRVGRCCGRGQAVSIFSKLKQNV